MDQLENPNRWEGGKTNIQRSERQRERERLRERADRRPRPGPLQEVEATYADNQTKKVFNRI